MVPIERTKTAAGYLKDLIQASDEVIARRRFDQQMPEVFAGTLKDTKKRRKFAAAMVVTTPKTEKVELRRAFREFKKASTERRVLRVLATLKFAQWGIRGERD